MADDRYVEYFTEKLWEMIPSFYRHEDGLAESPDVLRSLVKVLASQAAILRRSQDRLWEDQFIELCDDWAVPYLGNLVGTRMVAALNRRGRRVDVAKTIYYRRRKGTLAVLEELISDIASWEGTVVESFRKLGRCRHRLDPNPVAFSGPFTKTMTGGWANLRNTSGAELVDGPFDEFHRTPDARRHRGHIGRFGIPKLNFHLYRLMAFKVDGATPHLLTPPIGPASDGFNLDPSGRDVPLFIARDRPEWAAWQAAKEWDLPAPMRCRVLGHEVYQIDERIIQFLSETHGLTESHENELRTFIGWNFSSERNLRNAIEQLPQGADFLPPNSVYQSILQEALVDDCGKKNLIPNSLNVFANNHAIPSEEITAGDLEHWHAATDRRVVIDPQRGRMMFVGGPAPDNTTVNYHYGFSGPLGAGAYARPTVEDREPDQHIAGGGSIVSANIEVNGVTQIDDSLTYGPIDDLNIQRTIIQAANLQRPYLRLASDWTLDSGDISDAIALLEGLWMGSSAASSIRLQGDFEHVVISHCTLDPGGERTIPASGNLIPGLTLVVEGHVELLEIASCIVGTIRTDTGGTIERLSIRDSILQSLDDNAPALELPFGDVALERVTILGQIDIHRLWATETLITGTADVTDTQAGCFRFSAAPENSNLPRPYESHYVKNANSLFTSRRFGNPGYGQLSQVAPGEFRTGAENGSEIGAFSRQINPIKFDSLNAKISEFMPFGLISNFIRET